MEKRDLLYTGKAKSVYATDDADRLVILFRNDTSAFDGKKVEQLDRKGMVNNKFNAFIMVATKRSLFPAAVIVSTTSASSLSTLCSSDNVKSNLPSVTGINYGDVTASAVYNASVTAVDNYPGIDGRNFCNVTVNYSHSGKSDSVSNVDELWGCC